MLNKLANWMFFILMATVALFLWLLIAVDQAHADFIPDNDLYSESVTKVVESIYQIEGGRKASKPYGIFMAKCNWDNIAYCELACRQTVVNNIKRFKGQTKIKTYFEYLASRYAPIGAKNDPTGLNKNWLPNLLAVLRSK